MDFPNESAKWSWLAAVIDTETQLTLFKAWHKNPDKSHEYRIGFAWHPRMNISHTSLRFLKQVKVVCQGGSIVPRKMNNPNWKQSYNFALQSNGLRFILPQVKDFLIVKKEQADLLLEALIILKRRKGQEDPRIEHIYERMKVVNKRGGKSHHTRW